MRQSYMNDKTQKADKTSVARLTALSGPLAKQVHVLDRSVIIGRSPDCDIVTPDAEVSR